MLSNRKSALALAVILSRALLAVADDCSVSNLQSLQAGVRESLPFCMWWLSGTSLSSSPIPGLSSNDLDDLCSCIADNPTMATGTTMPPPSGSTSGTNYLIALDNAVAAPLPFCQYWALEGSGQAFSPFTQLGLSALYDVCAIVNNNAAVSSSAATSIPASTSLISSTSSFPSNVSVTSVFSTSVLSTSVLSTSLPAITSSPLPLSTSTIPKPHVTSSSTLTTKVKSTSTKSSGKGKTTKTTKTTTTKGGKKTSTKKTSGKPSPTSSSPKSTGKQQGAGNGSHS